jgi:hypothetical protein
LVQVKEKAAKIQDMVYESSKPMARYADDFDLENMLKAQEREGDPMLEYLREKRRTENPEGELFSITFLLHDIKGIYHLLNFVLIHVVIASMQSAFYYVHVVYVLLYLLHCFC